ncbi:hypothetical protein BDW67DRAFT_136668 [Aspergillus spinulosporus]
MKCDPLTHAAQLALFLFFPSLPSGPGSISPSGLVSLTLEPFLNPRISHLFFFSARVSSSPVLFLYFSHTLSLFHSLVAWEFWTSPAAMDFSHFPK